MKVGERAMKRVALVGILVLLTTPLRSVAAERLGVWLGVQAEDLSDTPKSGLLVTAIFPKGPAEGAGLRLGDIITEIDGNRLRGRADLREGMRRLSPGQRTSLTVIRGVETLSLNATVTTSSASGEFRANEYLVRGKVIDSEPGKLLVLGEAVPAKAGSTPQFLGTARILILTRAYSRDAYAGYHSGIHCFIEKQLGPLWVYGDCDYSQSEIVARNRRVAELAQMKEEILKFVEEQFRGDKLKLAWVTVTLHQTPERVPRFYKGLKVEPERLVETLRSGEFPYEQGAASRKKPVQ